MLKKTIFFLIAVLPALSFAQKKVLDHSDYDIWNTVQDEALAPDGSHVLYSLWKGEKDHYLKIQDAKGKFVLEYDRGKEGHFTYDSNYAIFTINAWKDSIMDMQRRKVKKDKLPKDSLGIFNPSSQIAFDHPVQ